MKLARRRCLPLPLGVLIACNGHVLWQRMASSETACVHGPAVGAEGMHESACAAACARRAPWLRRGPAHGNQPHLPRLTPRHWSALEVALNAGLVVDVAVAAPGAEDAHRSLRRGWSG